MQTTLQQRLNALRAQIPQLREILANQQQKRFQADYEAGLWTPPFPVTERHEIQDVHGYDS